MIWVDEIGMPIKITDLEEAYRDLKAAELRLLRVSHRLQNTTLSDGLREASGNVERLKKEVKEMLDFRTKQTQLDETKEIKT